MMIRRLRCARRLLLGQLRLRVRHEHPGRRRNQQSGREEAVQGVLARVSREQLQLQVQGCHQEELQPRPVLGGSQFGGPQLV